MKSQYRPAPPLLPPPSSSYHPSTNNNSIEYKLRNLQINLAQGRTEEELAKSGIYLPSISQPQQTNVFSNYIDSVHRALDSTKQQPQPPTTTTKLDSRTILYENPYENDFIQFDYKKQQQQQRFPLDFNPNPNVCRPAVPPRQSKSNL